MKSSLLAVLITGAIACGARAQDDRIHLNNGTVVDGVRVTSWNVRDLKYAKGGNNDSVATDQIAKVEVARFQDTFRRAIGNKDPDLMLTVAREQVEAKNELLAQLGLHRAAILFFDQGKAAEAVAALEELQKVMPEAGLVPEVYRQKFEYYIGQGSNGARSAATVAKKYLDDALGKAWPPGFALEAEFFAAMAERMGGGNPKEYEAKLRSIISKATGNDATIANRANVQLAHSLRESKDAVGARKIYEDLANKNGVDVNSRAGAYLGLGLLSLEAGGADKEANRAALLLFLRVRLETKEAWPSLQAEALYHAIVAADKWRGDNYQYVMARCRGVLFNEFGGSEWAQRAKR